MARDHANGVEEQAHGYFVVVIDDLPVRAVPNGHVRNLVGIVAVEHLPDDLAGNAVDLLAQNLARHVLVHEALALAVHEKHGVAAERPAVVVVAAGMRGVGLRANPVGHAQALAQVRALPLGVDVGPAQVAALQQAVAVLEVVHHGQVAG